MAATGRAQAQRATVATHAAIQAASRILRERQGAWQTAGANARTRLKLEGA